MSEAIVSRSRAIRILLEIARPLDAMNRSPFEALGLISATPITAFCDVPEQPSSVRDGYAVQVTDIEKATPSTPVRLAVTQTIHAESKISTSVISGETARVLTGGLIPAGSDTVLAEEDVEIAPKNGRETIIVHTPARKGWFVRSAGSEIGRNAVITEPGMVITPQAAAAMVRARVESVQVYPKPTARVLSLGSELSNPTNSSPDSDTARFPADNLVLAKGLLDQSGVDITGTNVLPDREHALIEILSQKDLPDIVITTGGTGRSERDFARIGAEKSGFTMLFKSVDIRPGRHMFAAQRDDTLLFGLPGPPAAVFACFHAVILPVIRRLRGLPDQTEPIMARFDQGVSAKPGSEWLVQCAISFKGSHIVATPFVGKKVPPMLGMAKAHGVAVLQSGDAILPDGEAEILSTIF